MGIPDRAVKGGEALEKIDVPYYVFESELARQERHAKRLWILCLVIFLALIATNAGWIYYESQWEDIVVTQEGEADDGSTLRMTGAGTVYGGESETDSEGEETQDGR